MNKKLSSEFAVAVILIVAGTFGYIFWKGSENILSENLLVSYTNSDNIASVSQDNQNKDEKWKLFRNDNEGYEFSLPRNWKLQDESGKFVAEGEAGEITVKIEENEKKYTPEDLLAESVKLEREANVMPLTDIGGVKIEKRGADSLEQTAKIIQGQDVITLTYLGRSAEQSTELFNKILPTFKAVN